MFADLWQDLRLACRNLRRARSFTIAAVLTLAVGMAGATSMFTLIRGVLLRPLPLPDESRVLVGWKTLSTADARLWPFGKGEIELLHANSRLLEHVAGVGYNDPSPCVLSERGSAAKVECARVTGGFFPLLGVEPSLGRALAREDDIAGAENVLVISNGLWLRRYGGSRYVIGRRLTINEQPFTIVGVMPRDLDYPRGVEAWMTVAAMQATTTNATFREAMATELGLIVRLRPGATAAQGEAELETLARRLDAGTSAGAVHGLTITVRPLKETLVGDTRPALVVLFAAVALTLLIACANVANLMLVRGAARRPEFAVRAALGASRARLVRPLMAESAVLSVSAGGIGLALAAWTLPALVQLVPGGLPRVEAINIDVGVALFTTTLALFVTLGAGLGPALSSAKIDLAPRLQEGSRGATSPSAKRGRQALVVAQVALAVTLVAAASLLTRSLLALQGEGVQLATDRLVYVPLALPQAKYAEHARHAGFIKDVLARLEATPGVTAATAINAVPFSGLGWDAPTFTANGQTSVRADANPTLNLEEIHPNYFRTLEVALVRGRAFTEQDREGAPLVAIVSEDVAARTWPGQNPIGQRLKMGGPASTEPWRTVVGVATPTRYRDLREARATLYVPVAQFLGAASDIVVRTSAPVPLIASLVRDRIRALDPEVQVMRVAPFAELLDVPLARPRLNAFLLGVFAVAALTLATIGLYAVMATQVGQRRRELGVRVALGASAADVRRLLFGEGFRLTFVGIAIGLVTAGALTRALRSLLYNVQPVDPVSLLVAALLLTGTAALACYLPARRATATDPQLALRGD